MSASGPLLAGVDANASTPDTRRWSCVVSMVLLSCGAALLWSPQPVPGVSLLAVPRVLPRALATAQLVPSAQKSGPVPGSPAVQPRLGAQDRAEGSSPWVQRPPSGVWSAAPPTARSVPHPHAHAESHVHTQPQSHWSARVAVLLLLLMPFVPRLFRWRRRLSDSQHTVAMSAVFGRWADGKAGRARPQAGAREAPQPQGIDFSPGPWSDTVRNALQQHQRDGTPVDGVVLQRSDAGYFVQLSDLKILAFLPLSEATGALARRKAKGEGEGSRVSASDAEPQEVQVKISKLDLRAQSVTVSQKLVGTSKVFRVHKVSRLPPGRSSLRPWLGGQDTDGGGKGGQGSIRMAVHHRRGGGGGAAPPPLDRVPSRPKVTRVLGWEGGDETPNRENLLGPFFVHKLLGPRPPLPCPPSPFLILPWRRGGVPN